jgi:GNAT superfamily N-acetyltransferase
VEYNYREGGARRVLFKAFVQRPAQWLRSRSDWLVYRLPLARYERVCSLPLEHAFLGFDDLIRLRYFRVLAFPEAVRQRLAVGELCHGFFLNGEIVNYGWTKMASLPLERGVSVAEPGCGGIYDCFTLPAHQGKGIYPATLAFMASFLRQRGAALALIAVDPDNRPSIKGIERAGFEFHERVAIVWSLGRTSLLRSRVR